MATINAERDDVTRGREFDARLDRCAAVVREIVRFLRAAAANAGPGVETPTFEVRGVGVTYWVAGRRFCRFDPKEDVEHVWAMVPAADRSALSNAGKVSDREDGPWVTVSTMTGAVRLVQQIVESFERIAAPSGRRQK